MLRAFAGEGQPWRCLPLLQEKGGKQPYYIKLRREGAEEDEPMVMAGLYDVWHSAQGPIHTYTILTTGAGIRNSLMGDCWHTEVFYMTFTVCDGGAKC